MELERFAETVGRLSVQSSLGNQVVRSLKNVFVKEDAEDGLQNWTEFTIVEKKYEALDESNARRAVFNGTRGEAYKIRRAERAEKRGGSADIVSFDELRERVYATENADGVSPFDVVDANTVGWERAVEDRIDEQNFRARVDADPNVLEERLALLPPRYRTVARMLYYGKTAEETAVTLGKDAVTIRRYIVRAYEVLTQRSRRDAAPIIRREMIPAPRRNWAYDPVEAMKDRVSERVRQFDENNTHE